MSGISIVSLTWELRNSKLGKFLTRPGVMRLMIILGLVALWEVIGQTVADRLFVAPPTVVAQAIVNLFGNPGVMNAIGWALIELVVAFVLAVGIGVPIGLMTGMSRFAKIAVFPVILMIYGIPQAPFLPLLTLIFGIGPAAKIAYGMTSGIFVVIVTVTAGVQDTDRSLLRAARSMGASRWQIFKDVVFPNLVPSLFTGMRLGMTGVLMGVMLAELYVSSSGVGYYSRQFAETFQPHNLFALIVILAALAIILNEICRRAEIHFSRWRD